MISVYARDTGEKVKLILEGKEIAMQVVLMLYASCALIK
jgi:hypothetical protein